MNGRVGAGVERLPQALRRLVERADEFGAPLSEMLHDRRAAALDGVGDEFADARQFARDLAATIPERAVNLR